MSENHIETKTKGERSRLARAEDLLRSSDWSGAFLLVKEHWLENPNDCSAVKLMAEVLSRSGNKDLAVMLDKLAKKQLHSCCDGQALFETAYRFIDAREPELAVLLLRRCVDLFPHEQMIRYELGFALMQMKLFSEAIPHFEFLAGIEEDFDTWLNLTVCHSIDRNLKRAEEALKRLEKLKVTEEEVREVALRRWVLRRMEEFELSSPGIRDWVFSLYGSILLSETSPRDLSGKPMTVATDYTGVASTLLVLRGFLQEIGCEFDVIEHYSALSRPLAEALARLMDLPAAPYGGSEQSERSLLIIAWASDIVGPHRTFTTHSPNRSIFAYGLTGVTQLPITPDIIGCLAGECPMPWAEQLEKLDGGANNSSGLHPLNEVQAKATDKILENAANLEYQPELIRRIEDLAAYYSVRKQMLVFRNCDDFPVRPEYTAEIPC